MSDKIDISAEAVARMLDGVTPGPWLVMPCGYRVADKAVTFDADGSRHGETPNIVIFAETQANARFIASARDLVPALRSALTAAEAERDALRAEVERLRKVAEWGFDTLQEINTSNYNHDDVCSLNGASVEVALGLLAALKGASHE